MSRTAELSVELESRRSSAGRDRRLGCVTSISSSNPHRGRIEVERRRRHAAKPICSLTRLDAQADRSPHRVLMPLRVGETH